MDNNKVKVNLKVGSVFSLNALAENEDEAQTYMQACEVVSKKLEAFQRLYNKKPLTDQLALVAVDLAMALLNNKMEGSDNLSQVGELKNELEAFLKDNVD